jgi:hypothetical protein
MPTFSVAWRLTVEAPNAEAAIKSAYERFVDAQVDAYVVPTNPGELRLFRDVQVGDVFTMTDADISDLRRVLYVRYPEREDGGNARIAQATEGDGWTRIEDREGVYVHPELFGVAR